MNEPTTQDELQKDREAIAGASEGPWLSDDKSVVMPDGREIADTKYGFGPLQDADFIARARTRWPAALDTLAVDWRTANEARQLLHDTLEQLDPDNERDRWFMVRLTKIAEAMTALAAAADPGRQTTGGE